MDSRPQDSPYVGTVILSLCRLLEPSGVLFECAKGIDAQLRRCLTWVPGMSTTTVMYSEVMILQQFLDATSAVVKQMEQELTSLKASVELWDGSLNKDQQL